MTCCGTKERGQYPAIQGCASGARYDLIISYKQLNPSQKTLEWTQDYLTYTTTMPIGRTPGECPVVIKEFDIQLTCVAENSGIYMIKRDELNNTFKIFSLATDPATDVTGTVSPIKCEDKEIESDIVERCVDGQDFSQHIVKIDGVPNGITYWTNITGVVANPIPTATVYTKGSCDLPVKTLVSAIPGCLINGTTKTDVQIEKYDTNGIVTEEVRIADFTKTPITRTQYIPVAGDNIQMGFCNLIKDTELGFESGCLKREVQPAIPNVSFNKTQIEYKITQNGNGAYDFFFNNGSGAIANAIHSRYFGTADAIYIKLQADNGTGGLDNYDILIKRTDIDSSTYMFTGSSVTWTSILSFIPPTFTPTGFPVNQIDIGSSASRRATGVIIKTTGLGYEYYSVQKHKKILEDGGIIVYYTEEDYNNQFASNVYGISIFAFNPLTDVRTPGACQIPQIIELGFESGCVKRTTKGSVQINGTDEKRNLGDVNSNGIYGFSTSNGGGPIALAAEIDTWINGTTTSITLIIEAATFSGVSSYTITFNKSDINLSTYIFGGTYCSFDFINGYIPPDFAATGFPSSASPFVGHSPANRALGGGSKGLVEYFNVQKHKRILEDGKTQTYYTQEDYANPNADGSFPFIPFAFNPITDEWSSGSCAVQKIALNATQYINVVGPVTIVADTRRELEIFNRNAQDVIVNYTTTNGGSGQKVISAQGSTIISLTENKNETHFETIEMQLGSYGLGGLQNNLLVINFKN